MENANALIHIYRDPDPAVRDTVLSLWQECRDAEGITLTPLLAGEEDAAVLTCLYGEPGRAEAVLTASEMEAGVWEISAFTRPAFRRQGRFRALFARLREETEFADAAPAPKFTDAAPVFQFYCDGHSADADGFAAHMGCELLDSEHILSLSLPAAGLPRDVHMTVRETPEYKELARIHALVFGWPIPLSRTYVRESLADPSCLGYQLFYLGKRVGCFLLTLSETTACLSGFGLYQRYRGIGLARPALAAVCACLPPEIRRLDVQVSESNEAAFHLYRSSGFADHARLDQYQI